MLWIDEYRPKSFKEVTSHESIVSMMKCYTLETIPNLIIYGQSGHNKNTLVRCLIEHLYGKYPEMKQKSFEIQINSKPTMIDFLESEEMVEITPSDYGNRDRQIIQGIVKEIAQNKPIMGMFGKKKRSVRLIVIKQAENLTRDAQAALRRTMEMYTSHFRIIMVCTEVSKLIEPIRSRSLFVRARGFLDEEIISICQNILDKESFVVELFILKQIAQNSKGSAKRAICLLEMYCFNRESETTKKKKPDLTTFKLDWELKIEAIVELIKSAKVENMIKIRKEITSLIVSCIDAHDIHLGILSGLLHKNFTKVTELVQLALKYEERMRLGIKPIFHLEAFAANAMVVFAKK